MIKQKKEYYKGDIIDQFKHNTMRKKVKVHMLPMERAKLYIYGGKLYYNPTTMHIPVKPQPQHLYFTSDEKIKEGDWYYNSSNHIISQADKRYGEIKNPLPHRKIVATTDGELGFRDEIGGWYPLPQISQSFIKQYCEAGGKINEVEIEYEQYWERVGNGYPNYPQFIIKVIQKIIQNFGKK